jgi:hypothetical protein
MAEHGSESNQGASAKQHVLVIRELRYHLILRLKYFGQFSALILLKRTYEASFILNCFTCTKK